MIRTATRAERRLLVSSCRPTPAPPAPADLAAADWRRLVRTAEMLRLAPRLYQILARDAATPAPEWVVRRLETDYYAHGARNLLLHRALDQILAAAAREGISVILLKGAALIETVYGNPALRPMRDLDLLVRPSQLAAAEQLLLRLGYRPDEAYRPRAWYVGELGHLVPYLARDGSSRVELHHDIAHRFMGLTVPVADLWARARPAPRSAALVPAPDDLLLHLAIHLAAADGFVGGLRDLGDVAALAGRARELDWDRFRATAHRSGASSCAYYVCWLARVTLGAAIPEDALERLRRDAAPRPLDDRALKRLARSAILRTGRDAGWIPGGIAREWCRQLLRPSGVGRRVAGILGAVYAAWLRTARRRGLSPLALPYALLVHPVLAFAKARRRPVGSPRPRIDAPQRNPADKTP